MVSNVSAQPLQIKCLVSKREAFCNRNTALNWLEFFKFLLKKFGDDQNSTFLLPFFVFCFFFFNNKVCFSRFYFVLKCNIIIAKKAAIKAKQKLLKLTKILRLPNYVYWLFKSGLLVRYIYLFIWLHSPTQYKTRKFWQLKNFHRTEKFILQCGMKGLLMLSIHNIRVILHGSLWISQFVSKYFILEYRFWCWIISASTTLFFLKDIFVPVLPSEKYCLRKKCGTFPLALCVNEENFHVARKLRQQAGAAFTGTLHPWRGAICVVLVYTCW